MNHKLFLASIGIASALLSCGKGKEDPAPTLTPTQLLTGKKWQVRSGSISGTGQPTVDLYKLTLPDTRDNFQQFTLPNTFVHDEGPTKYRPTDPQTQLGLWILSDNDTRLTISYKGYTNAYFIEELTSVFLRTRLEQPQSNGVIAVTITTFAVID